MNVGICIRNCFCFVCFLRMQTNLYMVVMHVSHLSTDNLLPWLRGNHQCIWQRGRQRHDKLLRLARHEQVVFLHRGFGKASQNGWLSSNLKFEPCLIWCFAEEPETSKLESNPRLPWPFTGRGILETIQTDRCDYYSLSFQTEYILLLCSLIFQSCLKIVLKKLTYLSVS